MKLTVIVTVLTSILKTVKAMSNHCHIDKSNTIILYPSEIVCYFQASDYKENIKDFVIMYTHIY